MSPITPKGPQDPTGPLKPQPPKMPTAKKIPQTPTAEKAKAAQDVKQVKKAGTARLNKDAVELSGVAIPGQSMLQALGLSRPSSPAGMRKVAETLAEAIEGASPAPSFIA